MSEFPLIDYFMKTSVYEFKGGFLIRDPDTGLTNLYSHSGAPLPLASFSIILSSNVKRTYYLRIRNEWQSEFYALMHNYMTENRLEVSIPRWLSVSESQLNDFLKELIKQGNVFFFRI